MPAKVNTSNKKKVGNRGEDIASLYLKKNGFIIIKRNYRFGKIGEIDIIIRKGDIIVFVEVKSRNSEHYGGVYYSITQRKKQTIKKVASQFLHTHPELHSKKITYRYDMIAIDNDKIEWIQDIFR